MDTLCLVIKILIIISLIFVFIYLYKKSNGYNREGFESIDYIKLNETHIEPEGTNLKLLYANYYGEEVSNDEIHDVWKDKTLEQCTDLCNQLNGCKGFSRKANVADNAKDECYPRTKIGICHSARKGDETQIQNAIKYNSFIKNGEDKRILTKCIGDPNMTLKRAVYIKSQMYPNKFIGTLGDGLAMLVEKGAPDFDNKCKFRVDIGQDGIGTVSFFHIGSNKYLSRIATTGDGIEFIGFKDINKSGTEDKLRASFNILDSMKNMMKFRCMRVNGENVDKFIMINPENNNYLQCSEFNSSNEQLATFDIVDYIISSKVINSQNHLPTMPLGTMPLRTVPQATMQLGTMPQATMPLGTMPLGTMPLRTVPQATMPLGTMPQATMPLGPSNNSVDKFFNVAPSVAVDAVGNQLITQSATSNNLLASNLDTTDQITLYNSIFNPISDIQVKDYLNDNYSSQFNQFNRIDKKVNDITLQQQLSKSLNKNKDTYTSLTQLNQEIERELAGLNMGLNAKNDKMSNNLGKMQLTDMANDYYMLKNVYPDSIN